MGETLLFTFGVAAVGVVGAGGTISKVEFSSVVAVSVVRAGVFSSGVAGLSIISSEAWFVGCSVVESWVAGGVVSSWLNSD